MTREQLGLTLNNVVDHGTVDDADYKAIMAHDAALRRQLLDEQADVVAYKLDATHYRQQLEEARAALLREGIRTGEIERELAGVRNELAGYKICSIEEELRLTAEQRDVLNTECLSLQQQLADTRAKLAQVESGNDLLGKKLHDVTMNLDVHRAQLAEAQAALKIHEGKYD